MTSRRHPERRRRSAENVPLAALARRGLGEGAAHAVSLVIAVLFTLARSSPLSAQFGTPSERWGILLVAGKDTIALERAGLRGPGMTGELLDRTSGNRMSWTAALSAAGEMEHMELSVREALAPPNAPAMQTLDLAFAGDSVVGTVTAPGAEPRVRRAAVPRRATPFVNPSMVMTEIAVRRLFATGVREGKAPLLLLNGQVIELGVRPIGADSIAIGLGGTELRVRTDSAGRFLGGRVPSQNLDIKRRAWFDDAELKLPRPDYGAPAGAPYTAEEVTIPSPLGFSIVATLTRPVGAATRLPVVVTITGSGPEDRDERIPSLGDYRPFRQLADTLGRRGIAVLRYDERGVGASGGSFGTATSADFADDIRTIVAWLRKRDDIDPARIVLVGHSEGGILAPMVAAGDPQLAGIVLMAGTSKPGRAILDFQLRNGTLQDSSLAPARRDSILREIPRMLDSLVTSTPWRRFFATYDPLATIRRVKVPVLILQGETDQQVTPEQAGELAAALRASGNARVTIRTFPETNHLFLADPRGYPGGYARLPSASVRPAVLGAVADWVAAAVGAAKR